MTEAINMLALGYPDGEMANNYYTAQVTPEIGVVVAQMVGQYMIQFFPWGPDVWSGPNFDCVPPIRGHQRYARFINSKTNPGAYPFRLTPNTLPFMQCPVGTDLLTIKCLIEEGIKQIGETTHAHGPEVQSGEADTAAGKAVE